MDSLFIAFPLPKTIISQLERLCFGLPNVQWIDPNDFFINVISLGQVEGTMQLDILEILSKMHNHPIFISLKNVSYSHTKTHGTIKVGLSPSQELDKLIKIISYQLTPFLPHFKPVQPHVLLGRFLKIDEKRLFDYLDTHFLFESKPFLVNSIMLMKTRGTQNHRIFCEELACYKLHAS